VDLFVGHTSHLQHEGTATAIDRGAPRETSVL
jgi:hypothetical protein